MRPTRATRKPDRYSPPPFPVRSYRPLVKRPRLTLSRAAQLGKKPPPKKFWAKIKKKTHSLISLETHVFGIDGIWDFIKSFIFRTKLTGVNGYTRCLARWRVCVRPTTNTQNGKWCDGLCPNNAIEVERNGFNEFEHYRQGRMHKGRFPLWVLRCNRCSTHASHKIKYKDSYDDDFNIGGRSCVIC